MPRRSLRLTPRPPPSILDTLPTEILDKVLQTTVNQSDSTWSRQSLRIRLSWVSKEWRALLLEKRKLIFKTEKRMKVMLGLLKDDRERAELVREIQIVYRIEETPLETLNELLKLTINLNDLSLFFLKHETALPVQLELYSTIEKLPLISFKYLHGALDHYELLKSISNWPSLQNLRLQLQHFTFTNAIDSLCFPNSINSLSLFGMLEFTGAHLQLLEKLVKESNISVLELDQIIDVAEDEFEELADLIKAVPEVSISDSHNLPKIFTKNNTIKRLRTTILDGRTFSYLKNFIELERLTLEMIPSQMQSQLDKLEKYLLNKTFTRVFAIDVVYQTAYGRPPYDAPAHRVFSTARSKGIEMRFINEWKN